MKEMLFSSIPSELKQSLLEHKKFQAIRECRNALVEGWESHDSMTPEEYIAYTYGTCKDWFGDIHEKEMDVQVGAMLWVSVCELQKIGSHLIGNL